MQPDTIFSASSLPFLFGENCYQETADKKSWQRFTEFLAETFKN
jgi:hypothetical protein